jgi:PAS domain S-box-containing protein
VEDQGDLQRLVDEPNTIAAELARLVDSQPALQDAYRVLLQEIGGLLGCDTVMLWMPDEVRPGLRCAAFWSRDPLATADLEAVCRGTTLAEDERDTVPGRAWQSRVPVWTDDLTADRRHAALPVSLAPAIFALPLQAGGRVVGVVELLCPHEREPDARLQRALVVLATGLAAPLERRLAEESTGAGRARLEAALEAGRMGVWDWEVDTDRVRWGPALEEVVGVAAGDLGQTLGDFIALIHPADRDWVLKQFAEALEGGRGVDAEYRVLRPDGTHRWIHAGGRAVVDASGRVTAMTGVATDVTERIEREQALRVQATQLELALEVAGLGGWGWRRESRTGWWSPGLAQMFGLPPEAGQEVSPAQAIGVIHPDDRRVFDDMIAAAEEGRDWEARYRVTVPTGVRHIRAWGRPIHDVAGTLWGMVGIAVPDRDAEPGGRRRPG